MSSNEFFREIEDRNCTPIIWEVIKHLGSWLDPAPLNGISPKQRPAPRVGDRIELGCLYESEKIAIINIWCYPIEWLPSVLLILDKSILQSGSFIEYVPYGSHADHGHLKFEIIKHTHNESK